MAEEPKSHRVMCPLSQNLGRGSPEATHLSPLLNFNWNFQNAWTHCTWPRAYRCLWEVRGLPVPAKQGKTEGLSIYFDECKCILLLVRMLSRPWWNGHPPLRVHREWKLGERNVQDRLLWFEMKTNNFRGKGWCYFRDLGILAYTFMN